MKRVVLKRGSRTCSEEIGGCGRTMFRGEVAYLLIKRRKGKKRFYMCEECYERKSY